MLVVLDASLLAGLDANPSQLAPEAIAIDLAAEALRQGTHIIVGDIPTLDGLIAHVGVFSERTRMLLARARAKAPFRNALIAEMLWHVRISATANAPVSNLHANGKIEIVLPCNIVANTGTLLQKARFIAENNNDGHFYEALTYQFVQVDANFRALFSAVRLKFDLIQGGGNTTGPVYAHEKALKGHFCLAVVDSDQSYPNGPVGETARRVVEVDAPPNTSEWNARALVLKVRAVENLFPLADLQRVAGELDASLGDRAACSISTHGSELHWDYLFLKRGLRCFELSKTNSPASAYLRTATKFKDCPNFTQTPCQDREGCETYVNEPLGDQLLAQICNVKPIQLSLDRAHDALRLPHIRALSLEMVSAFCGDVPAISP